MYMLNSHQYIPTDKISSTYNFKWKRLWKKFLFLILPQFSRMKDCLPNIIVKLEVNFQVEITILKGKEECTYDIMLEFSTWEYNSNPNIYMAYEVHIKIHHFYFEDMTIIASQRMKILCIKLKIITLLYIIAFL